MIRIKQFTGEPEQIINKWLAEQAGAKFISYHQDMVESKTEDESKPRICVLTTIVYEDKSTGGMQR